MQEVANAHTHQVVGGTADAHQWGVDRQHNQQRRQQTEAHGLGPGGQQPVDEIVAQAAHHHHPQEPVGTDGGYKEHAANGGCIERRNPVAYRQIERHHHISAHHDDVGQEQLQQIVEETAHALPHIHQIARDDQKGGHHEREDGILDPGVAVAEVDHMDKHHEGDEQAAGDINRFVMFLHVFRELGEFPCKVTNFPPHSQTIPLHSAGCPYFPYFLQLRGTCNYSYAYLQKWDPKVKNGGNLS